MPIITTLYHLAVSCWLGGAALFTFLLTPLGFASFPRDTAAAVVGALFPGYFHWGLACGAIALVCRMLAGGRLALASLLLIVAMLAGTAIQALVLEPRAAALKQEIVSFETTGADHPLRVKFRRLHGLSMAINLGVIAGGVVLVILAVAAQGGGAGPERIGRVRP